MNKSSSDAGDVGIYVGYGASHSWTWFADIFDNDSYYSISFLDENDIKKGRLSACNFFFVSGGDTFAIAQGLGSTGACEIEKFVRKGGTYLGSCAGAYLPLNSSLSPLNMFNFVGARISNLTKNLPEPDKRPEKFCTEYGCRYVFHPVREEVKIRLRGCCDGRLDTVISAPLYGGPAMQHSKDIEVLAEYEGFTEKTEFLIDRKFSQQTIIGHVAAARKRHGAGMFYLFGPHFEHPEYPEANRFLFNILSDNMGTRQTGKNAQQTAVLPAISSLSAKKKYSEFLSEISNARIVALALERTSYRWLIGKKLYDPEKIRVFLETIWHRARLIHSEQGYVSIFQDDLDLLAKFSRKITQYLRTLKNRSEASHDEGEVATSLFFILRETTAKFLTIYFRLKRDGLTEPERRLECTYISRQPQYFIH